MHRHAIQFQTKLLKFGGQLCGECLRKHQLVGGQVQERNAAAGDGVADVLQHQAAQLAVQVNRAVTVARARDFGVKQLGVGHPKAVVAKGAQAHRTKVLVADGDRLRCAPLLIDLLARAEEVHVALER